MSILIKDMSMPKNCGECPFATPTRDGLMCDAVSFLAKCLVHPISRMSCCPLVELPPHGDLIDRDKLETHHGWYNEDRERNVVQTRIQFVYANAILTAPVVVESEE